MDTDTCHQVQQLIREVPKKVDRTFMNSLILGRIQNSDSQFEVIRNPFIEKLHCQEFNEDLSQYFLISNQSEKKRIIPEYTNAASQQITTKNVASKYSLFKQKFQSSCSVSEFIFDSEEDCDDFMEHQNSHRKLKHDLNTIIVNREIQDLRQNFKLNIINEEQKQLHSQSELNSSSDNNNESYNIIEQQTQKYILYLDKLMKNQEILDPKNEIRQQKNITNLSKESEQIKRGLLAGNQNVNIQQGYSVIIEEKNREDKAQPEVIFTILKNQLNDNHNSGQNKQYIENQESQEILEQKGDLILSQNSLNSTGVTKKQQLPFSQPISERKMSCLNNPKNGRFFINITVPQ
eukprot:403331370